MTIHRVVLAVITFLFGLECAAAERPWRKLNSTNFELLTTAGERSARDAILYFEKVRGFFARIAPAKTKPGLPVRIIAFSSEKEFKPYQPNEFAAAYAVGGHDRDYIVLKGAGAENYPIAVHEYVHLLVKPAGDKVPLWLNEGLAELYSTLKPVGGKVRIGDIHEHWYRELQQSKWLDLETLTTVNHDSPLYNEKKRANIFYAESWALTHMLLLTDKYRAQFPQFLKTIASGDQTAAFEQAYGKKLWEVWMDLQTYMRRGDFNAGIFDVQLPKSAEQPEIREATALESGLALASLLGVIRKPDQARQAFEELARQNPQRSEVEEAFGYFLLGTGQREEARKHLALAAELGSGNPQLYYDCASMFQGGGERGTKLIPLLRKAVELDPGHTKARYMLGLNLASEHNYEEALKHLREIKHVDREQAVPLFLTLAYAHHRLGHEKEAIEAAEQAKKYAQNIQETDAAEQMLSSIKTPPQAAPAVARVQPAEEADEYTPPPAVRRAALPSPHLVERPAQPTHASIEGLLEQVDCLGARARLRLRIAGRQVRLIIQDPTAVDVSGAADGKVDFGCGVQSPRRVTILYDPKLDGELGTIGIVKAMEFK